MTNKKDELFMVELVFKNLTKKEIKALESLFNEWSEAWKKMVSRTMYKNE